MFSITAISDRLSKEGCTRLAAIVASLYILGTVVPASAEPASALRSYSGWRGGIGIAFGTPSRDIADVTEMGYEIVRGGDDPRAIKALGISVFRYWNSIVETSLKGPGYDFSQMADKDEAAKMAFDAWMERIYGVKGLSKYAKVCHDPKGAYGDVYGSMDLSSENELVKAVIAAYLQGFEKDGIAHGGIGLDNAGRVPREFLEALARRLNARGLGIAANGCPDQYLIDHLVLDMRRTQDRPEAAADTKEAHGKPTFPRLMGMNIGRKHYDDTEYQRQLARLDVVVLGLHKGWKPDYGVARVVQSLKR
jgi:hypothetical protein